VVIEKFNADGAADCDSEAQLFKLLPAASSVEQWYSTWGTRTHPRGYVKFKKIYHNNNTFVI
jgi:hypothetical protein